MLPPGLHPPRASSKVSRPIEADCFKKSIPMKVSVGWIPPPPPVAATTLATPTDASSWHSLLQGLEVEMKASNELEHKLQQGQEQHDELMPPNLKLMVQDEIVDLMATHTNFPDKENIHPEEPECQTSHLMTRFKRTRVLSTLLRTQEFLDVEKFLEGQDDKPPLPLPRPPQDYMKLPKRTWEKDFAKFKQCLRSWARFLEENDTMRPEPRDQIEP